MHRLQRRLENMYVNMHVSQCAYVYRHERVLQSREVWQEWKNKMTTSPRLEARVFIDEA